MRGIQIICITQTPHEALEESLRVISGGRIKTFSVVKTRRVPYIPVCIDPTRITPATDTYRTAKCLDIITIAKYQPRKHLQDLILAVHNIYQKNPSSSVSVTIVGSVLNQQTFQDVKQLVHKYNLSPKVKLYTQLPYPQVQNLLQTANLFILPASQEPLGYSVVEAMATGLPVIVTNEVGAKSYVEHGKNGFIIPTASITSLTNAIQEFLTSQGKPNNKKLQSFGKRSRSLIEKYHSPSLFRKKIETLL